jgi:hypothetical protein
MIFLSKCAAENAPFGDGCQWTVRRCYPNFNSNMTYGLSRI